MTQEKLPTLGNKKADILVVCDPPSAWLWQKGLPIGGDAIKLFARVAEECGFSKDDFYFVSPCPPIPEEIESSDKRITDFVTPYREQVLGVIERIDPALIVYLGKWAGRIVMGRPQQIMKARGSFTEAEIPGMGRVSVLPMLSPGHVLRRPEMHDIFRTDFYMVERLRDLDWSLKRIVETAAGKKDYSWCTDLTELLNMNLKSISVDTETTGLMWYTAGTDDPNAVKILTVQIGYGPGKAVCVPVDCDYYPDLTPKKREKLVGQLKQLLENPKIRKAGHNMKYDTHLLREDLGIYIDYNTDTQLLAFVVDENMQEKSLDECVRRWVPEMAGYNDEYNKKLPKDRMRDVSHEDMLGYGCGDADASYRLAVALTQLAKADKKQWRCYQKIIFPAIKSFCDPVEFYGIRVNTKVLSQLQKDLQITEREMYANLIEQVPPVIKRKHADKGLKFTRDAFTRDILFSRHGLKLIPKVFTKSTAKLPPEQRIPSVSTKQHLPYFQDEPFVAQLMEYIKLQKLRGTYVGVPFDEDKGAPTGFWKYIYNGEIHPSFMLHRVVTGRTACLTGDTLIPVLDARGDVPIKDIKAGDWVWSYGDDLKPVAAQVSWQGKTIENAELVEVVFKTQSQHAVKKIRCTPDHPFRLRDGTYIRADELEYGHRLLSLERSINHNGYRQLFYTGNGNNVLEHRLVADAIGSPLQVHHRDEMKTNNIPDNLLKVTPEGHGEFHPWLPAKIAKRETTKKKNHGAGKWTRKGVICKKRIEFDPAWAERELRKAGGKPTVFRDTHGYDYTCALAALERAGINWKTIRAEYNSRGQLISRLLPKARKAVKIHDAARILGVNFYQAKELLAADNNHMVLEVRRLKRREDVYDITVPGPHNFIANGVCLHNSENPNGQNFPKRGKLAKTYRKIFQARPGYVLLETDLSQAELRIAAWMANEKTMLKIYREGGDIHAMTAAHTMGLSLKQFMAQDEEVIEQKRFQAKAINFGFLYGMGWRKFKTYAKTDYGLDFTDQQAEQLREAFFDLYPCLVDWHESTRAWVREKGYVRALHGAVRHLPSINSADDYIRQECERQAINAPVQRFASDLGLMAMVRLTRDANPEDIRPIMFVHDALVVEVREEYADDAMGWVKFYMESPPLKQWFNLNPPVLIIADLARGYNLGEMDKCKGVKAVAPDWYRPELDAA